MNKHFFICISFAIFALSSGILYYTTPELDAHQEIDSKEYIDVAHEYVKTGRLVHPQHGMPVHPIGYYWLLGLLYSFISDNQCWIFLVQFLLSLLCFWIIYKMALILFGFRAAIIASVLASCNIGFIVFSQLILAEILLTTCLCGFLYTMILFRHHGNLKDLITAALFLVASVLVKPVALFFGIIMPFFVCGAYRDSYKNYARKCFIALFFFYVPITGYMIYNYRMFGNFAVTTLHTGNLYYYFLPRRIIPRLEEHERCAIQRYIDESKSDQKMYEQRSAEVFFNLLKKYPMLYCSALIESMVKIFFGLHATQLKIMYNTALRGGSLSFFAMQGSTFFERLYNYTQFGTESFILKGISLVEMCWLFIFYFLIGYAYILLWYRREYFLVLFSGSYVGYITFAAAFEGCGRYRMMIEPMLIVFAAFALIELYYVIRKILFLFRTETYGIHV